MTQRSHDATPAKLEADIVERRTLIRDEYCDAFFSQSQEDQFKMLVRRAIVDVYGSSWTWYESRQAVAQAAYEKQCWFDDQLRADIRSSIPEEDEEPTWTAGPTESS